MFKLLGLHKPGDLNIFKHSEFNTWYEYVLAINGKNREKVKEVVASVLVKTLTIDEVKDSFRFTTPTNEELFKWTCQKFSSAIDLHRKLKHPSEM